MKKKLYHLNEKLYFLYLTTLFALLLSNKSIAATISYVSSNPGEAQKYVLYVDGKPFYMTNIQVRLDKLRYIWGWDAAARDAIISRAASDGFNTVSIPIQWYEVETSKDNFNWTILDEYLSLVNKYNLKMELLWFGSNSGGHVQWLGDPGGNYVHLRTPDYVMYSPSPSSTATTSDYTISSSNAYLLDMNDTRLRDREAYVLGQVMAHIASWDASHSSKHPVIGVQIENECVGQGASTAVAFCSSVARGVKNSSYVVWTRMNCVWGDQGGRIDANEALRSGSGTNIDFIGVDVYTSNVGTVKTIMPTTGKNYKMIMECGAEVSNAAQFFLSALSGDNGFDYYDMCGPDGHGLYDQSGTSGFTPNGSYISDVRTVNKLINSDIRDIATKAHGYSLYVHNSSGGSTGTSTGVRSVSFTPSSSSSQAISINRSSTEIVLMNTKGGTFTYPSSLGVSAASVGYFDSNNSWVNQGSVSYTSTSITPAAGTTVRLTVASGGGTSYFSITNRNSGKALDVKESSTSDNAAIVQWTYSGTANQQWQLVDAGGGYYRFVARHSGKCMRSVNGDVIQYTCDAGAWSQQYERVAQGSYYQLKNRNTGLCVQVVGGSTADGADIEEATCNSTYYRQQFSFTTIATSSSAMIATATEGENVLESVISTIDISPNPASSAIQFTLPYGFTKGNLKVFDVSGKLVYENILTAEKTEMDVSSFKPGLYFINVTSGKQTWNKKFQKN